MNYILGFVVMAVFVFMVMRVGMSRPNVVLEAIRVKKDR
jgi:hypothetical protein